MDWMSVAHAGRGIFLLEEAFYNDPNNIMPML